MKVKSFVAGFARGVGGAVEILDRQVSEQLDAGVTIHSVTDTYYNEEQTKYEECSPRSGLLVRVITYDDPS